MKSITLVGGAKPLVSCFTHCGIAPVWTSPWSNELEISDEKKEKPQKFSFEQSHQGPLESARISKNQAKTKPLAVPQNVATAARNPQHRQSSAFTTPAMSKKFEYARFSLLTGARARVPLWLVWDTRAELADGQFAGALAPAKRRAN